MAGPIPAPFVSQGKILLDMPGPKGFAGQLLTCTKFDVKQQGSVEVVTTIGVSDGAGHRKKQGGWIITATFIRTVGSDPEVDWVYAQQTDKVFTVSIEDEGNGRKESWLYVRVSKIDTGKDPEGKHEDEVEMGALQHTIDS